LTHPTEIPITKFSIGKYISNQNKQLLSIGNWMRDHSEFSKIRTTLAKYDLNNSDTFLSNDDYDNLLSQNLVCIFLKDASAINTVIECIVRNTPIIVNPLPAVVEYLGEKYPLYANDHTEAMNKLNNMSLILNAFTYLCNIDKTKFTFNYFNTKFEEIMKSNKISSVDPTIIPDFSALISIPVSSGRSRIKPTSRNIRSYPYRGHDFYEDEDN
jgi:hypothetical protein